MTKLINFLQTWVATRPRQDRGITMVEYAIMASIVAVTLVLAFQYLADGVDDLFTSIADSF